MNLPNKLTILRIILVPIMVIIYYIGKLNGLNSTFLGVSIINWILLAIFSIASYTDHLDGKIARRDNKITTFGKFADPLADKILVLAAMLLFVEEGKIPAWIPIIVLFREFVVSGYRLIAVEKGGKVIAANMWGKIKTVTQMTAIIIIFLCNYSYFEFTTNSNMEIVQYILNIFGSITLTISVIATIFSGYEYLKDSKELLKDN